MGRASTAVLRPTLKPALRRVWRDHQTLQIGVDPAHAVVITALDDASAAFVDRLDGTRRCDELMGEARSSGLPEGAASYLLTLFTDTGVLDDAAVSTSGLHALRTDERERLSPDLAAASITTGALDGGAEIFRHRRERAVEVHGAGRIGASVATLLAAAGIGHVIVVDPEPARLVDVAPAGLGHLDAGRQRAQAALAAVQRTAPAARAQLPWGRIRPNLVVLAPVGPLHPYHCDTLTSTGMPHIYAGMRETVGVVGPLVVPGRSSCLRCHDLQRAERDPAWPRVAAQLASTGQEVAPCDIVTATLVAAHTVGQVLRYLDGGHPSAINGTLEVIPPDGLVFRRSWVAHPSCGCVPPDPA